MNSTPQDIAAYKRLCRDYPAVFPHVTQRRLAIGNATMVSNGFHFMMPLGGMLFVMGPALSGVSSFIATAITGTGMLMFMAYPAIILAALLSILMRPVPWSVLEQNLKDGSLKIDTIKDLVGLRSADRRRKE